MLGDITIGQMYPSNSVIHRLDPRFKLVFTVIFVVALFCANTPMAIILNIAFVLLAYVVAKIPFKMLVKTVKPIVPIVLFMTIFNLLFYRGETVLLEFWVIKISREGLEMALFMIFRITLIIAGTAILTYTTSSIELTDGIESLFSPLKALHLPVHELAMMMTIALRFIPTLLEETDKIQKAQMARGADFESGNLIERAKAMIPLLVPLFVSAFKRANDLAMAMEARCYRGGDHRTRLRELKYTKLDLYGALAVAAYMAIIILEGRLLG